MIGSVGEEIVIDTRLPLYRPKTRPKRGTQGVFSVDVLSEDVMGTRTNKCILDERSQKILNQHRNMSPIPIV